MAFPHLRALTRGLRGAAWDQVEYWSLDLETGGLVASRNALLAVGMVPIRGGVIHLHDAWGSLVQDSDERAPDPGSIAAHHILPSQSRFAPPLEAVIEEIDRRLSDHVLLAHHAPVDLSFLERAYRRAGRRWREPIVVDTVRLIWKWASRRRFLGGMDHEPAVNLSEARTELGLPPYPAHDAITDAIATAELFLTLRARLGASRLSGLL